ncbi:unnamed protein product [Vicia faba]|uniref:Uncharacterized protein n=1 Tax=Vicia faba TaxID=3906 RepID=A0AAV0ZHR4_VICFA|nr:unnamed protein product [Vicia faba]
MPPKKKTIANMEAKIADLEQELSLMKVAFSDSIAEVQQTARENQRALMQMMEKVLGKKVVEVDDGVSSAVKKATTSSELKGEALDEFRRSVKKVELPAFSGCHTSEGRRKVTVRGGLNVINSPGSS